MLTDLGANEQQFILASKKGLHSKENKKYFEQLIACDNFLYFKNMMVKKNLQLEEQAYKLLHENMVKKTKQNLEGIITNDKDYIKHQEKKEKMDMIAEKEMSQVVDEEKQKLDEIQDLEDLKKADFGLKKDLLKPKLSTKLDEEEEISLYNNNNLKGILINKIKQKGKLNPVITKTTDAKSKETVKQLEQADKEKKPTYVSPLKKVTDSPKVDATKDNKSAPPNAQAVQSPVIDKKSSIKPIVESKLDYVAPDISKMTFEDESHNQMKKKLEADLANSVHDSKQLENQYDQLQKDKENKLKEYREMIMKMKKEKRKLNADSNDKNSVIFLLK